MGEIYPVTPDQVSNDLETAMTEFDEARKLAKDAIEAFEVQHGMGTAAVAGAAIEKLGMSYQRLSDIVALLSADVRRFKTETLMLRRRCVALSIIDK